MKIGRRENKNKRGEREASDDAPVGKNKTPFPTMISHPREGGIEASKGPHSANFTDSFHFPSLLLKF